MLQTSTHKEGVPDCRVWPLAAACSRDGKKAAPCCCGGGVCARATEKARVSDSMAPVVCPDAEAKPSTNPSHFTAKGAKEIFDTVLRPKILALLK